MKHICGVWLVVRNYRRWNEHRTCLICLERVKVRKNISKEISK